MIAPGLDFNEARSSIFRMAAGGDEL